MSESECLSPRAPLAAPGERDGAEEPDLELATRPEADPARPGRYVAHVEPRWNAPIYPQGGVASAIALRAMEDALGNPLHVLHNSTTMFASPVDNGEIEVEVEVVRAGRGMSQCLARVSNPSSGGPGHRVMAAFGATRDDETIEFTGIARPAAPPPLECEPSPRPPPEISWPEGFFDRLETRRVRHFHSWEEGWQGGEPESIRWVRFRRPPGSNALLPSWSLTTLSDTMPSAIGQHEGPNAPPFMAPSVDLTLHYFDQPRADEWILLHSRARRAHRGYASAENALWSESGTLLAYATQTMLLRINQQP